MMQSLQQGKRVWCQCVSKIMYIHGALQAMSSLLTYLATSSTQISYWGRSYQQPDKPVKQTYGKAIWSNHKNLEEMMQWAIFYHYPSQKETSSIIVAYQEKHLGTYSRGIGSLAKKSLSLTSCPGKAVFGLQYLACKCWDFGEVRWWVRSIPEWSPPWNYISGKEPLRTVTMKQSLSWLPLQWVWQSLISLFIKDFKGSFHGPRWVIFGLLSQRKIKGLNR